MNTTSMDNTNPTNLTHIARILYDNLSLRIRSLVDVRLGRVENVVDLVELLDFIKWSTLVLELDERITMKMTQEMLEFEEGNSIPISDFINKLERGNS